jgi:hypothetical protein
MFRQEIFQRSRAVDSDQSLQEAVAGVRLHSVNDRVSPLTAAMDRRRLFTGSSGSLAYLRVSLVWIFSVAGQNDLKSFH